MKASQTAREAQVFGAAIIVAALVVMLAALGWAAADRGTCTDALLSCPGPARWTLAIAPAVILMVGGLAAFVRAYATWRRGDRWQIWQGAGWFLFLLMLVYAGIGSSALGQN